MKTLAISSLLLLPTAALAQSTLYGIDLRGDVLFTSDTADFVAGLTPVGANNLPLYSIDFDETGTTLWAVQNTTLEYGTIDLTTGAFNAVGVLPLALMGAPGMTCSIDGTWYLSEYDSTVGMSNLYSGDVTTGSFSLVGVMGTGIMIDISIDSSGNLYGHNISDDSLHTIDTSTGASTPIGPTGQAANFAQGMDFDWLTGNLYATIYTGGGTGVFAQFDLTTGVANVINDTTPTNGEFEIAFPNLPDTGLGTPYCTSTANSAGGAALVRADGSTSVAANDLTLSAEPVPNQPGIFYFGPDQVQLPFGDGFRCVGGQVIRLTPTNGSNNVLTRVVDLTVPPVVGNITGGSTWNFQAWFRDPAAAMSGFNLSNGVEIDFQP